MEIQEITNIIGSLGFPIAAACYLAFFSNRTMKEFKASVDANTSTLRELTIYINEMREERKKIDE